MLIYYCIDKEQFFFHDQFFTKNFLFNYLRDYLFNIRVLLHFAQLANWWSNIYISYIRSTQYARRAAARVHSLPLRVHSFFRLHLRASQRRVFPPFVEWIIEALHLDAHTFFYNLAKFSTIESNRSLMATHEIQCFIMLCH